MTIETALNLLNANTDVTVRRLSDRLYTVEAQMFTDAVQKLFDTIAYASEAHVSSDAADFFWFNGTQIMWEF